jgi:hypothetical protein
MATMTSPQVFYARINHKCSAANVQISSGIFLLRFFYMYMKFKQPQFLRHSKIVLKNVKISAVSPHPRGSIIETWLVPKELLLKSDC